MADDTTVLLAMHREAIDDAIATVCRRAHLSHSDAEDFAHQEAWLFLLKNNARAIRGFARPERRRDVLHPRCDDVLVDMPTRRRRCAAGAPQPPRAGFTRSAANWRPSLSASGSPRTRRSRSSTRGAVSRPPSWSPCCGN